MAWKLGVTTAAAVALWAWMEAAERDLVERYVRSQQEPPAVAAHRTRPVRPRRTTSDARAAA